MKILFIGETWKGSSARSLREGLDLIPSVLIDEVGEDHYRPHYKSKILRLLNRIFNRWQITDLEDEILRKLDSFAPDVLLVYKGSAIRADFLQRVKTTAMLLVNVFPDVTPHGHGAALRKAIGFYDYVISTKPFHPAKWQSVYGYSNPCVCVPHGYDPAVHYWTNVPDLQEFDVALAASWRKEYHELMLEFASAIGGLPIRVALSGPGWNERRADFPSNWEFHGPFYGRSYGTWLRRAKIVIAPVHSQTVVNGSLQPGDEDTTRSYELAAAGCFFLHKDTPYIRTVYDEQSEVPMWKNAQELATLVQKYLPLESKRRDMAAKAHRRAVPAYSIPSRALQVHAVIQEYLNIRLGI